MLVGYIDANTVIALATVASALFALALFVNAHNQLTHNRKVERAYVKISHSPPGIEFDSSGHISLTVSIKNYGKTPARVTDVVLKPVVVQHGDPLQTVPDYITMKYEDTKPKAFLVTDDEFILRRVYKFTSDEISDVIDLLSDLYMIGYVDYIDQFDQHHRGGYARRYWPKMDDKSRYATDEEFAQRNNLIVVTQEGYNYDRVRKA